VSVAALVVALLLAGLAVGPLLGIVVDRAADRLPPAAEHRCVHCEAGQGHRSLLPVAGWFRPCPRCRRLKGRRYPLVDAATATVFAMLAARFGASWVLAPYLGLAAVLVVLSAIDLETHLLPNIIVWPAILTGLFAILVFSGELDQAGNLYAALAGGLAFGGFLGAAHLAYEPGMGRGDVKLGLLLGLFVGWLTSDLLLAVRLVLVAILLALAGGGVAGLAWNRIRRRGRAEIPFGPALATAALAVILVAAPAGP
jgi:leader peptidase (prepilin peptidase)/N-methyltransferase